MLELQGRMNQWITSFYNALWISFFRLERINYYFILETKPKRQVLHQTSKRVLSFLLSFYVYYFTFCFLLLFDHVSWLSSLFVRIARKNDFLNYIFILLEFMNDLILIELYMLDHHIWCVSQIIHNDSWDNLVEI